ncbi:MAG: GNAT family N-acetyltransferase [Allosphingosinicella sp.]
MIETARLMLRGWHRDDFGPYAAMLSDPDTARFITRNGQAYGERETWHEMTFLVGHWQVLDYGMFVVEERETGRFLGRIGPLQPIGWPGFEIAWGLAPEARGKGYASEAAAAAIDWSFASFDLDRIVSIIHPRNLASQRVAGRVGERRTEEQFTPFREACDVWELRREDWRAR